MPSTRVLLKKLLVGPIVMTALADRRGYAFEGKLKLDELLEIGGGVLNGGVPEGTDRECVFALDLAGYVDLRAA